MTSSPNKSGRNRYESIMDYLDTLMFVFDENNAIEYVNPAVEKTLNLGKNHIINQPLSKVFEQSGRIDRLIRHCRENNQKVLIDNTPIYSVQKRQIIKAHMFCKPGVPVSNHKSTRVYMECQLVNLKTLSVQDDNAEKMALVKGIAHEVKNPLSGIRGAAQLLEQEVSDDNQRQFLRIIVKEADRLNDLLDRLSSHAAVSRQIPVNIHKILEHTFKLIEGEIAKYKNVKILLKRDYDPSLPEIIGNHASLIQVFLNLARNSLQALLSKRNTKLPETVPENHITHNDTNELFICFRTRLMLDSFIEGKHHRYALKTEIIDNGPGIAAEHIEKVFEPLVSFKKKGTGSGLGLAIAKDIIHDHGGDIYVNSSPDRLTTFSVLLPIQVDEKKSRKKVHAELVSGSKPEEE